MGASTGGVLYLLYEAWISPNLRRSHLSLAITTYVLKRHSSSLQLARLLLNPLSILLFIETQRLLRPLLIWTRKFDLLYLIFFVYHILMMLSKPSPSLTSVSNHASNGSLFCKSLWPFLVVDFPHALPASIGPQFTVDLRE
jgi:hypothetical protein